MSGRLRLGAMTWLDDLDYMGVTVLAHRKLILKGIEDLRKNKRVTIQQVRVRSFPLPRLPHAHVAITFFLQPLCLVSKLLWWSWLLPQLNWTA